MHESVLMGVARLLGSKKKIVSIIRSRARNKETYIVELRGSDQSRV